MHFNTLWKKMHGQLTKTSGGQTILSIEEEKDIVAHVIAMASFGFPITIMDLRLFVKGFLDRNGQKIKKFKNNTPGKEWIYLFLDRHKGQLSNRIRRNICRSRASLNAETINNYFDNLYGEIDGIPPERIWNYDETNLTDDPGSQKILVKRGTKFPDQIKNSTKASVSIMFCGNAAGQLAPPYVTYRAEGLYQTWTEGGPQGCRYNRSKSIQ